MEWMINAPEETVIFILIIVVSIIFSFLMWRFITPNHETSPSKPHKILLELTNLLALLHEQNLLTADEIHCRWHIRKNTIEYTYSTKSKISTIYLNGKESSITEINKLLLTKYIHKINQKYGSRKN